MKSKFGTIRLTDGGYYQITSNEKGHKWKSFHRVLFEDFYNMKIPKGYIIHHKNGNPKDNCILNLQLMRDKDHRVHHSIGENNSFYGRKHTKEVKEKIGLCHKGKSISEEQKKRISKGTSKSKNSTGYYRVSKRLDKKYKTGVLWSYYYVEDGVQKHISSTHFDVLKEKVLANGLKWEKL